MKDLRLLQTSQKLKANSTLREKDGSQLTNTACKLKRWHEHFEQVSNISTKLVDAVVAAVVDTSPSRPQEVEVDNSLSCVPSVEEIAFALRSLKLGRAPGKDEITAELLKVGGGVVYDGLFDSPGLPCVGVCAG